MGRRSAGEGSIYQRKDRSWVAQYKGKYKYAKTKNLAQQKLLELRTQTEAVKPKNITIEKHLDKYIEVVKTHLKPRTVKRYGQAIEAHLKPAFGKKKLHRLDAIDIQDFYVKKLSEGVSPSTIQLLHAVLSSALKRGVRWKLIEQNPCKNVELPRTEREEVEPFTYEEASALLSAAKHDRLEALWVLGLTTGMREGELIGAKRGDVDLEQGTLCISRTVYNGVEGTPKSKRSRRTIKLPHTALDALHRHIEQGDYADDDWLFPNTAGNPIWCYSFIAHYWRPLTEHAGIQYKNFHTCRHYVASTLLGKALPITAVAAYLGHDVQTLLRVYAHFMPDMQDAVADAMNNVLSDAL
jgi:integrase